MSFLGLFVAVETIFVSRKLKIVFLCLWQVRLSILCAYLFGKSELFVAVLRWAGHAGALLKAAAQPLAAVLW